MGAKHTKVNDDRIGRMAQDIESLKETTKDHEDRILACESEADKDRAAFQDALMVTAGEAEKDRKKIGEAVLAIANHGRENQTADIGGIIDKRGSSPDSNYGSMSSTL